MGEERRSQIDGWPARPATGRYQGVHRAGTGSGAISRRMALVGLAVGAVLVGTGALAATLPAAPDRPSAPQAALPSLPTVSASEPPGSPGRPAEASPAGPPAPVPEEAPSPSSAGTGRSPSAPSPTPTGSPPSTPTVRSYEAEEAELSGFVRIFPLAEASAAAVVGMIGLHQDSHIKFTELAVDRAGEYELTLYYVSAPDREAILVVNDGEQVTVEFPGTRSGREVAEVTVPVELLAGDNEIWFGNSADRAPALDRLTVTG